jgi:hypothetical protein
MHMKCAQIYFLSLLIFLLVGCQTEKDSQTWHATIYPGDPAISISQPLSFEVTKTVRTNGCTLELRRYTNKRPSMQGYWTQKASVNGHLLFRIEHSTDPKEQTLTFHSVKDVSVMQIDRDLDGKYDLLLILSSKSLSLIDALVLTDDGWWRHATKEEFEARVKIAEDNKRDNEQGMKILQQSLEKARKDLSQ